MNTRNNKNLQAFENAVVSVVRSEFQIIEIQAERGRGSEGKGEAELEAGTQSLEGTDLEGGAEL